LFHDFSGFSVIEGVALIHNIARYEVEVSIKKSATMLFSSDHSFWIWLTNVPL
jgi:paraquat-inducible protein B